MRKKVKRNEGLPMMGTVRMVIRDAKTGRVKRRIETRNKITYLAADVLIELLAQRATDPVPISKDMIYSMRMGSSNTAPTRADTNLGAFVIGVVIGDSGKVNGAPGELTLIATLESGDANGNTLREACICTAGASPSTFDTPGTAPGVTRMLCRQVYADIPKTSAITVDYSWTLAFVAAP